VILLVFGQVLPKDPVVREKYGKSPVKLGYHKLYLAKDIKDLTGSGKQIIRHGRPYVRA
jgi:hypothetical protein